MCVVAAVYNEEDEDDYDAEGTPIIRNPGPTPFADSSTTTATTAAAPATTTAATVTAVVPAATSDRDLGERDIADAQL